MFMKISGGASALLLLAALLAAGAADDVTTAECAARGRENRVRQYPVDNDATRLFMHGCSLTSIEPRSLTGLPAVTSMWLWGNELRELPVFDEHVCANLTDLSLLEIQLTEISKAGTFSACTKLELLFLNYNQIEFIHHSVFTALNNLKNLYLHNNKIRFIPDQMFSNNGKLVELDLHDNRITYLSLEFASRLKRAAPSLEEFTFFNNPWHCACLIELLADAQRAGVRNYVIFFGKAYDGRAPVCVFTGAAPCCRRAPAGLLPARGGGLRGGGLRGGGLRGGGLA